MRERLQSPSHPISRLVSISRGFVVGGTLFVLLLVTNAVQMSSMVVYPLSPRWFRGINRWCAHIWWGICLFVLERVYRLRFVFSGERLPVRENVILIANHQQMSDIPALMALAWRKGRLGDLKWIVKDQLKYVPGVGWGMRFLGCVFVKRLWAEDKEHVEAAFAHLHKNKVPVWLVVFPEGTRITPAKLERSRKFALRAGLRPTENVLLPRTKGFTASVEGLRGHVDAVYDVTIGFPQGVPTLWQLFRGDVSEIHVHSRRFACADLPKDREELSRWLNHVFEEKDELMGEFHRRGSFPAAVIDEPYSRRLGNGSDTTRSEQSRMTR